MVANGYAQDSASIVGKWKVVSVTSDQFFSDVKNDTIIVSNEVKRLYPNSVGMQNEIASIRTMHSYKIFVFTDRNEFFEFISAKSEVKLFSGTYTIYDENKMTLDVENLAKIKLKKQATFNLQDNLLHLTMHVETNSPIKYVLEKVEN